MLKLLGAAVAAVAVFVASSASAATWFYSYGPFFPQDQPSYPAVGAPISFSPSSPANIDDAVWNVRVADFAINTIRISNARPGDTVSLGTFIYSLDYLGVIGADGTFEWNGALSPYSGAHDITFFHLNVGTFSDGHLVNTSNFTVDEMTFSGRIPSPAPEPATWAMMITGFGLAGTTLRRRRPLAAAA